jgi:hypothetical protein
MKRLSLLVLCIASSTVLAAQSGTTVILNGTAIDPGTGKIMPSVAITIEGDHISAIKEHTARPGKATWSSMRAASCGSHPYPSSPGPMPST